MKPKSETMSIFSSRKDPRAIERSLTESGFCPGQTAKPPLGKREIIDFYRAVAEEISSLIAGGPAPLEFCPVRSEPLPGSRREEKRFPGERSWAWEGRPHETP